MGDAIGILCIEARDVREHRMMHETAPTAKDHLTEEVSSTEARKPRACYFPGVVAVSVLFMVGPLVRGA